MPYILTSLAALIFCHFLADYPLQGPFLSSAKNRLNPIPAVPWYQAMFAHAFMHGFLVYLVLQVWWLGVLEFIAHFIIDDHKCSGRLSFNEDQALHLGLKVLWIILAITIA